MNLANSIVNRLTGAFIVLTFALSAMYGSLVYLAMKYTEDDILTRRIEQEAENYFSHYRLQTKELMIPNEVGLNGYLSSSKDIPDWVKAEPLGVRELHDREVHIGVFEFPDSKDRLYLVLSEHQSSNLERELSTLFTVLVGIGAIITLIGLAIGQVLSKRVASPIIELTNDVTSKLEKPTSPFYAIEREDEVGELSRSFSTLVGRMSQFLSREREFTRFTSHELRTPVALIKNALGLMLLDSEVQSKHAKSITRIDNAVTDIESIIQTFLHLARESDVRLTENVSLAKVISKNIKKNATLYSNKHLSFEITRVAEPILETDPELINILFDNIIRNMFEHGGRNVKIIIDSEMITFQNDIHNFSYDQNKSGIGREIIERLTSRLKFSSDFSINKNHYKVIIHLKNH